MPPIKSNNRGDLGLNPANYANIEDEVQMEMLQAQQQRQFHVKNNANQPLKRVGMPAANNQQPK